MIKPFKTTLLDQHLRKKRRKNEKLRQEMLQRVLDLLPQLAARYGFNRAYVFGSLVKRGRFRKNSDVDIAIEGLNNENYLNLWPISPIQSGGKSMLFNLKNTACKSKSKKAAWNGTREVEYFGGEYSEAAKIH
jgi:predicted nucleotidyltransferase